MAHGDNQGSIALAVAPKMRPRNKHIAIKYHYFRIFITKGEIVIENIDTMENIIDIFTKYLDPKLFG